MLSNRGSGEFGVLPRDGWGFDSQQNDDIANSDSDGSMSQTRLGDATVTLPTGEVYTHRFILDDYPESDSVHIVKGQTFKGASCDTKKKGVGNIGAALFDLDSLHGEGLQMAADTITEEVYEATVALFTAKGRPIKGFKKLCRNDNHKWLLYISGVFITKDCMGRGLGLDIVRALILALREHEDFGCDLVVLCPFGDPPKTSREESFHKLVDVFGRLGFSRCGCRKTNGLVQGTYMFLEPDELDEAALAPPSTVIKPETPPPSCSLASAMPNVPDSSTVEETPSAQQESRKRKASNAKIDQSLSKTKLESR